MFRRLAAACALIALAVLALGGAPAVEPRESREEVMTAVGATTGIHGVPRSRRVRSNRGPSADRLGPADEQASATLGLFRWLWLPTAARVPAPPALAACLAAVAAPAARLASPALAPRSSRGPPARS